MNRVSSYSNDENRMKNLNTTVPTRILLAPYGGDKDLERHSMVQGLRKR